MYFWPSACAVSAACSFRSSPSLTLWYSSSSAPFSSSAAFSLPSTASNLAVTSFSLSVCSEIVVRDASTSAPSVADSSSSDALVTSSSAASASASPFAALDAETASLRCPYNVQPSARSRLTCCPSVATFFWASTFLGSDSLCSRQSLSSHPVSCRVACHSSSSPAGTSAQLVIAVVAVVIAVVAVAVVIAAVVVSARVAPNGSGAAESSSTFCFVFRAACSSSPITHLFVDFVFVSTVASGRAGGGDHVWSSLVAATVGAPSIVAFSFSPVSTFSTFSPFSTFPPFSLASTEGHTTPGRGIRLILENFAFVRVRRKGTNPPCAFRRPSLARLCDTPPL